MGKTPKPLRILVHPSLSEWPELAALREQGHTVDTVPVADHNVPSGWEWSTYNLVLGPTCWRMDATLQKYLAESVKAARAQRYPTKKGAKE